MGILVLGQFYDHVTVLSVKENTNIKKAQSTATYVGTQLNFEDKDGEVKSAKWNQEWLDNHHQSELKSMVQSLKAGDKVTLYKEKTVDEDKYNAITDPAAKKKAGFWTVKKIYKGHIEPPESAGKKSGPAKKAAQQTAKGQSGDKDVGWKVGHSIKGATTLLLRLKKPFLEGAKEVYHVTTELHKEYMESTGLDDYSAGQTVGNAVLNACFIVSQKAPDLKATARKILGYIPEIAKYIAEQETPVQEPPAEPIVESDDGIGGNQMDAGDDLPW